MVRFLRRQAAKVLLGLGLCAVSQGLLLAQAPHCPAPVVPAPASAPAPSAVPSTTPSATPGTPGAPGAAVAPGAMDPGAAGAVPGADPGAAGAVPPPGAGAAAAGGSDDSNLSQGMAVLGRGDYLQRFNLFDNNSALPQNRVWFGYQNMDKVSSGFGDGSLAEPNAPLTQRRIINMYRAGAEVALNGVFSISAQAEYVASAGTTSNNDAWSNPQFMLKWAAINEDETIISAILGYQPETSQTDAELHERATRIYPGVLFFQGLTDNLYVQGGFQFGIPFNSTATTFDLALSAGVWLYRDEALDVAGRPTNTFETSPSFISGVIPVIELFGKHVLSNSRQVPYDTYVACQSQAGSLVNFYQEGQNVYDITVGLRIMMLNHINIGAGYSFPITGAQVRQNEFLSTVGVNF